MEEIVLRLLICSLATHSGSENSLRLGLIVKKILIIPSSSQLRRGKSQNIAAFVSMSDDDVPEREWRGLPTTADEAKFAGEKKKH